MNLEFIITFKKFHVVLANFTFRFTIYFKNKGFFAHQHIKDFFYEVRDDLSFKVHPETTDRVDQLPTRNILRIYMYHTNGLRESSLFL